MAREIWDFKESGWVATGDSVARSGLVFFFLERLEMLTSQKRNLSLRRFLTNWSATEYGMSCTTWTKLACLIVLDLHVCTLAVKRDVEKPLGLPVHDFIVTNGVCVAVLTVMLESPASNVSRI
ncbi:Uncharacterized protein APZ42_033624 [Daphnia magna]|uniref:Uncharacterized protein n=1 Tax=Daphnia magna TaxID=35525 RepID=A0A164KXX5_9CRUS|nr:Uncharacterized protein APZ42_033624 [Daphnia magna]